MSYYIICFFRIFFALQFFHNSKFSIFWIILILIFDSHGKTQKYYSQSIKFLLFLVCNWILGLKKSNSLCINSKNYNFYFYLVFFCYWRFQSFQLHVWIYLFLVILLIFLYTFFYKTFFCIFSVGDKFLMPLIIYFPSFTLKYIFIW